MSSASSVYSLDLRSQAASVAADHRRVWERKPVLREIYADLYGRMVRLMSNVEGAAVELGAGPSTLKTFVPGILASDIAAAPWLDLATDACRLPFGEASIANLLLVDVLHHLPFPHRFLAEACRVLRPGGRIIILDPYLSLLSYPVYHFLHPERATWSVRPLHHSPDRPLFDPANPWNIDQGASRAIFWKERGELATRFPQLQVVHRSCLSVLMWPLSGGFEQPDRLPRGAVPLLWRLEKLLERFGRWLGFRCLVALERTAS
jgi:SAM-dependent methyltransferase